MASSSDELNSFEGCRDLLAMTFISWLLVAVLSSLLRYNYCWSIRWTELREAAPAGTFLYVLDTVLLSWACGRYFGSLTVNRLLSGAWF